MYLYVNANGWCVMLQTVGLRRDRCLWQCADAGVYINCAADQVSEKLRPSNNVHFSCLKVKLL